MTSLISVIIPVRAGGTPETTLTSLERQTLSEFDTIVVRDKEGRGACWARNEGLRQATTPFVLFSDDDVDWDERALEFLYGALTADLEAAYAYGNFSVGGRVRTFHPFSAEKLREQNYVTTMSLVFRGLHPGWDESLQRLQDWDVYLTMLERGLTGVYCDRILFNTAKRKGITHQGSVGYEKAAEIVRKKHGLERATA